MTEHPGEQFPPDVDPDVEPGFEPYPSEEPPAHPDYDTEPGSQNHGYAEQPPVRPHDAEPDEPAELDESAAAVVGEESGHVDPAEVEFGPEFARSPGQEHEHSFVAGSAEDPQAEAGHPLVEDTMSRLDELRDRPVSEHAEVYADLHERLQSALVEADVEHGDRG
ncbi:MAG TPA: hypothetical protein VFI00_22440 [Kribbella sp.]|nr:hypothetical protein [Kribbella sp.]